MLVAVKVRQGRKGSAWLVVLIEGEEGKWGRSIRLPGALPRFLSCVTPASLQHHNQIYPFQIFHC